MLHKIKTFLIGDLENREEFKKFAYLAAIFFMVIGVYWALRPMKDSLFFAIVGKDWYWFAKIVSMLIISPLVVVYSKLIDKYERHKLFYALMAVYALISLFFMWAFMHPEIGLANKVTGGDRLIGWAWYAFVESFGSIIVALFWAFTTDTTSPDAARRYFPMVILFGQFGNMIGPKFLNAKFLGFGTSAPVVGLCAIAMIVTAALFWHFMKVTPKAQLKGYQGAGSHTADAEKEPGFFEGLKLLVTQKYLLGMFFIISMYEVLITIYDNHFKMTVAELYPVEAEMAALLSTYGSMVGVVGIICVLLRVNSIQKYLGITFSMLMLPSLVALATFALYTNPDAVKVAMWIMILSKALNYSLNQPVFKQLYIPTSPDTKYKAQAWLEMFGSRGSKAIAASISSYRPILGVNLFISYVALGAIGGVAAWMFVAVYVAKTYTTAIKENRIVC